MNVNAPVVILVIIAAFALLIWMVRRDQHDKHRFEKKVIDQENKTDYEQEHHSHRDRL